MKKLRFIVLIIIGVSFIMTWNSCKKGPEDPFFSLYSRKHRVVGDWTVSVYTVDFKDSLRRVIDSLTIQGGCGEETDKTVDYYNYIMTFDKNGGYIENLKIRTENSIDITNNTVNCFDALTNDSVTTVTSKKWNFTGNIGDVKNKEQLVLFDPETLDSQIFDIIKCSEKQMKLQIIVQDPVTNIGTIRQYTLDKKN
ncbi:MAG: hypothetical protein LH473_01525 [Chitinophagales bacterium]|nr:hypothetical protein [Chitinophagales bacterium]